MARATQAGPEKAEWGPGPAVVTWQIRERIRTGLRATVKAVFGTMFGSWSGFGITAWSAAFTAIALIWWPAVLVLPSLGLALMVSALRLGTTPAFEGWEEQPDPPTAPVSLAKDGPDEEWEDEEAPLEEEPPDRRTEVYPPEQVRAQLVALAWQFVGDGPGAHLEQMVEQLHADGLTGWTVKDIARLFRSYGITVKQLWLPGRSNLTGVRREDLPLLPGVAPVRERKAG